MCPELALNAPRWSAQKGGFTEAWYVVAGDPRGAYGLWVRYVVDMDLKGQPTFALWGAWFEGDHPFVIRNQLSAAAIELLDVKGPGGVRVPMFDFRFHGETHRFADLPWIALSSSRLSSPAWHFSAQNARLAIDGVARAALPGMVQVEYVDPAGKRHWC